MYDRKVTEEEIRHFSLDDLTNTKWVLKINYWWSNDAYDEEPDEYFDSREDAYDRARTMALEEARISSTEHGCDIPLRFYEGAMCDEVDCGGAYAVIDLTYAYDVNANGRASICRYIVTEETA